MNSGLSSAPSANSAVPNFILTGTNEREAHRLWPCSIKEETQPCLNQKSQGTGALLPQAAYGATRKLGCSRSNRVIRPFPGNP